MLDFSDDTIEGDLRKPEASYVVARAPGAPPAPEPEPQGGGSDAAPEAQAPSRSIIYTGNFSLVVGSPQDAQKAFMQRVEGWGGYMQATREQAITVRIPAQHFREAVEWLPELGRVVRREVQAEDVTRAMTELRLRIENAERSRGRLLQLLEKATLMEDVLKIEKELSRITEELELLKAQLRGMEDRVAYSTLTVEFRSNAPEARTYSHRQPSPFPWINSVGAEHVLQ